MTELERELRELGRALDLPGAPELGPRVRARLVAAAPARPHRRRVVAVALAVLAVAAGALLAVPSTRSAILDFFGLGGVTVQRVDRLPATELGAPLALGERVSLTEARRRVAFRPLLPPRARHGNPDAVFASSDVPRGVLSLLYGTEERVRLLLTEFVGSLDEPLVEKSVGGATRVERVVVDGEPGLWIEGEPHVVLFRAADGTIRDSRSRLAANVLVWQRGALTLRLEGAMSRREAIRIAESLR